MSESTTPFPLGAYLGNPNNADPTGEATFDTAYASFTDLMGAAPQYLDSYIDYRLPVSEWPSNNGFNADSTEVSPASGISPVIGLALASTSSGTPDQYFKQFAAGDYDTELNEMVQRWAADGYDTQYWRPGWEMNLVSSPSYAGDDPATQADWVSAFQHVSTVLHAAGVQYGVNVQVVWNPSVTNYSNAEAITNLYPGSSYVDVIGADFYGDMFPYGDDPNHPYDWDANKGQYLGQNGVYSDSFADWLADPVNREHYWAFPAATPYAPDGSLGHSLSLTELLAFAASEGKPFALPETGAGNSDGGHDVGDDAAFPDWLAAALKASGDQIAFVNPWDSNGGGNYEFSFAGDDKPLEAAAWAADFGATPCYCRGTLILTDRGEVPVESLQIGDHVVTGSCDMRPIRWIGTRSYAGRFVARNRDVLPVLIRAGALADGVPKRDLMISPLHAMYLDGALVPAACLVNGHSIIQLEAVEQVHYFHIELDTHDVIVAEGALSETFVDDDSRGIFHNAASYRAIYPDAEARAARYCAPRLEGGAELLALHQRLLHRALDSASGIPMPPRQAAAARR
jgi:hypothetical protein